MSDFIPNSTQVPNLYIDRLMALLSGDEWKVLSYVARRTFGFQKRKDRISANQISDGLVERKTGKRLDYGTGISRGTALKILADLKSYSVLKETAPSIKQKNISTEWALNLDSTTVNWNGLEERQSQKLLINQGRTKRARAKIKSSTLVCGTDQVEQTDLVCGTDQGWSVGQTNKRKGYKDKRFF